LRITKLLLTGVAASAMILAPLSGVATAKSSHGHGHGKAHGHDQLKCFDGTTDGGFGGVCRLGKHKNTATLDNTDSNPAGDYAGVYAKHNRLGGKLLSEVKPLGYHYVGTIAPNPGNLSLNVPLDENNDGTTEEYAFVDAFYCPGVNGTVDIINDPNCVIYVGGVTPYPNWAALVAANPTWKVATDHVPILIAERTPSEPPAFWTVDHVKFGKPGK